MKRGLLTAIASALAVAALGAALSLTASPGARAATADAATTADTAATARVTIPQYVLYNCSSKGQVRPASEILTCADAGMVLQGLHWAAWAPLLAAGHGTLRENDCRPNCAEGHFSSYPVKVAAWGSASVPGHPGQRHYTKLTLLFTGPRPPVYKTVNGKVVATYPVTQTLPAI